MAASVPAQHGEWWRNTTISRSFASGFAADPGLRPQQEPLITHWGVTHVDEAAAAQSWFTLGVEHELDDLFQSFRRVWRDDEPLARQLRIMISVVSGGREPPLYRSVRTVRDSLWSYGSHSSALG